MINIQLYQQRLEWLKEWMDGKIFGTLPENMMHVAIEVECVPKLSIEQIMVIYNQTGTIFFTTTKPEMVTTYRVMNFEEYCKHKQSSLLTLK